VDFIAEIAFVNNCILTQFHKILRNYGIDEIFFHVLAKIKGIELVYSL